MTIPSTSSLLMIVNPVAGRRRRDLVESVVRGIRAEGWAVDVVETMAAGDARRLAETCDASRYRVLGAAGGDGTINEVVNGLARRPTAGPPFAVIPLGTANVLAHELGLGFSAASIVRTVTAGQELPMWPGEARESGPPRYFSLMAGAGFDAKVVAGVSSPLKRRLGRGAYVWRTLVEAWRYRPVRYAVEVDGTKYEAASVIVTRARNYAGPYVMAPDASLGDPLLHACLFERWGRTSVLRFAAALLVGRLPHCAGFRVVPGRVVCVSVLDDAGDQRRQPVQIDGDDALTLPASIRVAAGTVRVLQ